MKQNFQLRGEKCSESAQRRSFPSLFASAWITAAACTACTACAVYVSSGSPSPRGGDEPGPAKGVDAGDEVKGSGEDDPGTPPDGLKVKVEGNPAWVVRSTTAAVLLGGGGRDQDDAMRVLVERGGRGDVVVLRMDDPREGYGKYLVGLGADSVHEVVFDAAGSTDNVAGADLARLRALANTAYVERLIENAEVVFLAGGNQTKYLDVWEGTALARALGAAVRTKRIALGGTSAGMHVLGGVTYAPREGGSVLSTDALRDPYIAEGEIADSSALVLRESALAAPWLGSFVFDTHTSERNRLGRSLVFLARVVQDRLRPLQDARLVACDQGSAVVVEADGQARVFGATEEGRGDYAFFVKPEKLPEACADNTPLLWTDAVTVLKVAGTRDGRNTVDLRTWQTTAAWPQKLSASAGVLAPEIQTPN